MKSALALAVALLVATPAHGMTKHGKKELAWENAWANMHHPIRFDEQNYLRYQNELLVPLLASPSVSIDPGLPVKYRYALPSTESFIIALGKKFYRHYHRPIKVNSAVRTKERQRFIAQHNVNAIGTSGSYASLHLCGCAVDIAKLPLNWREANWMKSELDAEQAKGLIRFQIEGKRQTVYHIVVTDSSSRARVVKRD